MLFFLLANSTLVHFLVSLWLLVFALLASALRVAELDPLPWRRHIFDDCRSIYANSFTGSIPSSIAPLTKLTTVNLRSNTAPIAVPGAVCTQHYSHLSVSGVELACPLPAVSACGGKDITALSGVLLPWRTCTGRSLDSCYPSLAACSTLWSLQLSSKSLAGTVPGWLGSFQGLQTLYVPPCVFRDDERGTTGGVGGGFERDFEACILIRAACLLARWSIIRAGTSTPTSCRARCRARWGR